MKKIRNWNWLLITPIFISAILIVIRFLDTELSECIESKTGLRIYQMIAFVGAISGLLWTNKRYKQSEEIAFKNKMNTQYLEVIKAISDENQKKTPIVSNLINAIQASIDTFHYANKSAEDIDKIRKETLNFRWINLERAVLKKANLRKADLRKADLRGADVSHTNLIKADLTEADLRGADLTMADLTEADLKGANLTMADLKGANLKGANLIVADLTGAYLTGADLTEADLRVANLTGANLMADLTGADLTGADLTNAIFTINSLNTLSPEQLDSAKYVTKIKIYIFSRNKSYSLKEFVKMNPSDRINNQVYELKKDIFDYLVELSKKN